MSDKKNNQFELSCAYCNANINAGWQDCGEDIKCPKCNKNNYVSSDSNGYNDWLYLEKIEDE